MRTKHLFYTLALSAAFAACSQEEVVNAPANQLASNSFAGYSGEVYDGTISFTKEGDGVDSRMSIVGGTPSWADGDKVGLVWTNAEAGIQGTTGPIWTAWPTTNKIFSNTRMTYDANTKDFFMTDGQVFKGMYFAYYPFNEEIQSVQQFKVSQSNVQEQTNSTTETLNQVATDLVWMSQRYEDNEEVMTPATFLYPLTEDNVESGVATNVNIRMKPFSNILDARFLVVDKKDDAATSLDPKEVVVKEVILGTRLNGAGNPESQLFGGLADIPTVAAFDLSSWQGLDGSDFGIPSSGQSGLDGRKLTVNSVDTTATGYYTGEQKVGTVSVTFADEKANAGKMQRVNFMFLPHKNYGHASQVYEIKVLTDYGYAIIPETAWMKTATNQGGLYVNPNAQDGQVGLTPSYQLKNLTDRIGMQAVRYFNLDIADLIYNDLWVGSTEELCEVLGKWNALGESGELRVFVKQENNFADFDWCADSKYPEIVEFLADANNDLIINQGVPTKEMNLTGETHIEDTAYDQLHIETPVEQEDGKMTIEGTETINGLMIDEDAELLIPAGATLNSMTVELEGTTLIETDGTLKSGIMVQNSGKVNIEQNGAITIEGTIAWLMNTGEIVTNGDITAPLIENQGDFRIKTHSNTDADKFTNKGNVYYDEQGVCSKITNDYANGGRIIATILEGAEANTLADYIIAANAFKCTDLVINKNDFFTTGQWDTSLYNKDLAAFKNVEMKDGVEIVFTKGLKMKNATVTIAEDAVVTWSKGVNVETPVFTINYVVVDKGATLNVSEISVANKAKTKVKIGSGKTTSINGIVCFDEQKTETITADDGTSGSIDVK